MDTGNHELSMGQVKFNDTPKVIDEKMTPRRESTPHFHDNIKKTNESSELQDSAVGQES